MPEASRLEDELQGNFPQSTIELVASDGGNFKVFINDSLIFDKLGDTKRFPKELEITNIIKQL